MMTDQIPLELPPLLNGEVAMMPHIVNGDGSQQVRNSLNSFWVNKIFSRWGKWFSIALGSAGYFLGCRNLPLCWKDVKNSDQSVPLNWVCVFACVFIQVKIVDLKQCCIFEGFAESLMIYLCSLLSRHLTFVWDFKILKMLKWEKNGSKKRMENSSDVCYSLLTWIYLSQHSPMLHYRKHVWILSRFLNKGKFTVAF